MLNTLTDFESIMITISKWKLRPESCIHLLITHVLIAVYTGMVKTQLNIPGGLMFTANCLLVKKVELRTT